VRTDRHRHRIPRPTSLGCAYLAYRLVPLTKLETTGAGVSSMDVRRRRLRQLCQSYADGTGQTGVSVWDVLHTAITCLEDLAAFTARRAAAGAEHVAAHVQHYLADASWIGQHLKDLHPR